MTIGSFEMDSLAIQRSLTILEDRYRELREIGEKRFESFDSEVAALKGELKAVMEEKDGIAGELKVAREEKDGIAVELVLARKEKDGIAAELKVVREEKSGIAGELCQAREEADLCLLQLRQVQEELEYYFFEFCRQAEKLHWLHGQRELLVRMLRAQGANLRSFMAMDGRIALSALKRQSQPWWHLISLH